MTHYPFLLAPTFVAESNKRHTVGGITFLERPSERKKVPTCYLLKKKEKKKKRYKLLFKPFPKCRQTERWKKKKSVPRRIVNRARECFWKKHREYVISYTNSNNSSAGSLANEEKSYFFPSTVREYKKKSHASQIYNELHFRKQCSKTFFACDNESSIDEKRKEEKLFHRFPLA